MTTTTTTEITAYMNNTYVNEPCPLCGLTFRVGGIRFTADRAIDSVCNKCTEKHAPDLAAAACR